MADANKLTIAARSAKQKIGNSDTSTCAKHEEEEEEEEEEHQEEEEHKEKEEEEDEERKEEEKEENEEREEERKKEARGQRGDEGGLEWIVGDVGVDCGEWSGLWGFGNL